MTAPQEHLDDAQKLEADGYVDLFEIYLPSGAVVHVCPSRAVTWQGTAYEQVPIHIEGVGSSADEESKRPKLSIANPDGAYLPFVRDHELDNATVARIRVLREHLEADQNIYRKQQWRVRRILNANKYQITMELRSLLDGQFFQVPGRMFIPPEFPLVSLG